MASSRQPERYERAEGPRETPLVRRRHEREEEGYFHSADDEQHAYQEVMQEMDHVKDQSVNSTRNALRRIRETEETAANSMRKLQEQTGKNSRIFLIRKYFLLINDYVHIFLPMLTVSTPNL
jgi:hypothetical protein